MAKNNKSYRIRTKVGQEADTFLDVHLDQDYDSLEILSLKLSDKDTYKLHNSDYGVVVGRVLANGNFGVPNAKISVFIQADEQNSDMKMWNLYPYESTSTKNEDDIRYNLLPDESVKDCHKAVGTFPNKTYMLENDALLEVFDKYYVYTTRTNAAGDYLICGVPTGMQTLHMDLDLSDCGILSQRPRDFVYKGYTIEQFENPNQFKKDENLDSLAQIFSQNQPVYVQPFWGNEDNGETIGITRADIEISFKFEPTCVFMGSAISDNASNGVGKKCVPTNQMGAMDELTAGEGTIEMIRKTPDGNVEEFPIKGNQLINGNGVWCYQIPMNLDYMMTDEYGNMVPTDDPEKGIPTRTRVRFRASLTDMENSSQSYYRAKFLIPNNPGIGEQKVDYNFGTYTDESSYRDLFWNGVYTVKSYIPRFQKSKRWKSERFSGIKACNYYGGNNPMPYNNMRIKLPFMFTVLCVFVKLFIKIVTLVNRIIAGVLKVIAGVIGVIFTPFKLLGRALKLIGKIVKKVGEWGDSLIALADNAVSAIINPFIKDYGIHCTFIGDGLCPDMEGWYFAPGCTLGERYQSTTKLLMKNTLAAAQGTGDNLETDDPDTKDAMKSSEFIDETSVDVQNTSTSEEDSVCLTRDVNYLLNCFEMNLAEEYRVIKFDFYNDWVNGVIYFPRWMRKIKRKKKYKFSLNNGVSTYYKDNVKGCMNSETSNVKKSRYYTQQCSLSYTGETNRPWTSINTAPNCYGVAKRDTSIIPSKCHKKQGMDQSAIFGKKSGLVTEETTMLGQYVYYLKPCEWNDTDNGRVRTLLFATDMILLGTLNDCDENGIPQAFKYLNNSSYIMPTNLALTTMDDEAYIYANPSGTVCSSTSSRSSSKDGGKQVDGVTRVTPNFESTHNAYTNTDGDMVDYGENDDPIPVTESAGITWNYSGPGQDDVNLGKLEDSDSLIKRLFGGGNKRYNYLYYPGGHFLGLSCTNSDSNIKSCVNLKRICEVGATMSQRREELRGYTEDPDTHVVSPKYRYYVPTGLISNVDIEGAAFRSMFATLNHNVLVATEKSEVTGYKKYNFRFLRPDGFDGSLFPYVHQKEGSPYNSKVNTAENPNAITDATNFFERVFRGLWSRPEDYDENEIEFTERRTVEDTIDDYYMFRFGLDGFSAKEQRQHYLSKKNGGFILPQYENSFYFYFGLKDGSTALDEFKKQFFSECESNNIMRAPTISIVEKIDDSIPDKVIGKATLIIDNMIPSYIIVLKDNTLGIEYDQVISESDTFSLDEIVSPDTGLTIGHEYTVTVTDSLDHTATKAFVFGASAVKIDAQSVNFRIGNPTTATNSPKKGGYIKINDKVTILKKEYNISGDTISFQFRKVENGVPMSANTLPSSSYTDESGELWYLYYPDSGIGIYETLVYYNGCLISVYTTTMDDNAKVNLFVSCDYLAYKPEFNPDSGSTFPCYTYRGRPGLQSVPEDDWYNGNPFSGNTLDGWLMRHSFYRQTQDDNFAYDNFIYTKGKAELAIFGVPESGNRLVSAEAEGLFNSGSSSFYSNDYNLFRGYLVDDTYTFIPTMFYDWEIMSGSTANTIFRHAFDAMSYTDDGRAAADATDITITGYNYSSDTNEIALTFDGSASGVVDGHGCIVVLENGIILFPVVSGNSMIAYGQNAYPGYENIDNFDELLGMATVYPSLRVPSMYKPFYGIVSAETWNVQALSLGSNADNETIAEKKDLPLSYKVEGDIYNGLTYNDKFYLGGDHAPDEEFEYDTYLVLKDNPDFWQYLTESGLTRVRDKEPFRKLPRNTKFGQGVWSANTRNFGREISGFTETDKDISEISYAVTEAIPSGVSIPDNVYTERYENGFDKTVLSDSCSIEFEFFDDLVIRVMDESLGLSGACIVYTEQDLPEHTTLFRTGVELFDKSQNPLTIEDDSGIYCHGYYNENAKFDKKGTEASITVKKGNTWSFKYSETQDTGVKINKTANNEDSLKNSGITLTHQYTLNETYKKDISKVTSVLLSGAVETAVGTRTKPGDLFSGAAVNTFIAVYERPDTGTRNKMVVYKLYPLGALDVLFPPSPGGIDPYLRAPTGGTYSKEAQTVSITVSTNVKYKVTITNGSPDTTWLQLVDGPDFEATANTVSINIDSNTGVNTSDRWAMVHFECIEDGVEVTPALTCDFKLTQSKDDVTPVQNEIDNFEDTVNDALDDLQTQIDNLNPDTGSTGN